MTGGCRVGRWRGVARFVAALAFAAGAAAPVLADPSDATDPLASDADYVAGKAALAARSWADAVLGLTRAERRYPENADLQNELGYSYRNLKRFDDAFAHYKRALALDPRHRGAHEYIGEAYLMVDDLPGAERHLAALREICLLPCEELDDLQKAVDAWKLRRR